MTKCKESSTLMSNVIFVSLESFGVQMRPAQAQAALATDINYLSYGNSWGEPNSTLTADFSRFAKDGIEHVNMRMLWSATDPPVCSSSGNLSTTPACTWTAQSREASSVALNIYTGTSPKQAYYELAKYPG
jgi:hypothetical protein